MFYSQFILARKGPLGTIWIAAHLERKLRKNQVADTDIGESVDSILFPDFPIALRLSSHLLLGVVRIYSRKVNYLFHDCSETLLRVKQAFRSTAVDLPPEESTAPYHSITLPETFDLDDFELPDSVLLNGNFVDHHISTREQITLQDTVDAAGYSTSQFGLDERFGDGDTSQIGLYLDEDIVLDKESSLPDNLLSSEGIEHEIRHQDEESFPNMDIDGFQNDYDEDHPAGTTNNLGENSAVDLGKAQDTREQIESPLSCPIQQNPLDSSENAQTPSTPALIQEAIPANFQNMALSPSGRASPSNDLEPTVTLTSHMEFDESGDLVKDKHESAGIINPSSSSLRPCTSGLDLDPITQLPFKETVLAGEENSLGTSKKDEDLGDVISKSSRIEVNCSASSEYPEPEMIMLLATGGDEGIAKDLEQSAAAEKGVMESDGSVDRGVSTRGRKRQLTESSPHLTLSLTKSGREADYIPDDDDVLASILVGRSSLKLKSTPSLPTAPPSKRQRLAAKSSVAKRKTLCDDKMVLHPDAIREQLISTEDIRRTRRKAPCTRSEIWAIQKCSLEEGIFGEPVLTGMPVDLVILHDQTFDLNDAPDPEFSADYSAFELPRLSEKSKEDEKDGSGKEETPDAVEGAQLTDLPAPHLPEAVADTSSSEKGGRKVNDAGQLDDNTNPDDAGLTAQEGALTESTLETVTSEISPVKAPEADVEENPSTVGENSVYHDAMDLERSQHFDSNDFCSAVGGNDTGFLVVDDEADFDDADNELPDAEEAQSMENSGWSSRTKGVARFLRSLFEEETAGGRTAVAVDQLMAGKTRKEASRMFFETLVLSTKDFILVEQESSFKSISIRLRSKLLKSEL